MSTMFWIWTAVIICSIIVEIITADLISIWFTCGAVIPFILAATNAVNYEWQIVIFVVVSVTLLASLRKITKKYLLRNSNLKTNVDSLIGQKFRLLHRTDFETVGKIKVKDVDWSVIAEDQGTIEEGAVVEIVKIAGNKLIVKEIEKMETKNDKKQNKGEN